MTAMVLAAYRHQSEKWTHEPGMEATRAHAPHPRPAPRRAPPAAPAAALRTPAAAARPRGRGHRLPAAGLLARPALLPWRPSRHGPRAGRVRGAREGDQALPARSGCAVHELRGADDPRRAAPLHPRHVVEHARAAAGAGARPGGAPAPRHVRRAAWPCPDGERA